MSNEYEDGTVWMTQCHFKWTIQNIFSYESSESFFSPDFFALDSEWYLALYPGEISSHLMSLGLVMRKKSSPRKTAKFSFGIKRSDGTIEKVSQEEYHVYENEKAWESRGFLSFSDLLNRKSELAPFDALTIVCTLRENGLDECTLEKKLEMLNKEKLELLQLSQDYKDMFLSKKGCDATLIVKDREFPIHRGVLQSRSPVFASMFETDMKEKNTNTVHIVDCDPKAFRDFLLHVYSGTTEDLPGNAFGLYRIADKYDVQDLKSKCVDSMLQNLSCETLCDLVDLAHQYADDDLKRKAQDFFNGNFKAIVFSDRWVSFLKDSLVLANELLKKMSETM